ncbi:MAG: YesL family protein [Oscillospiraceae bacterium]|nr:YesL family protein [Oscillospiraceae bacterium]
MANLFSPESAPYKFMSRLTDIVKLSLLWLLFSLPIVTMGISTIAAFTVTLKMAEETEGHIGHDFLKAFKANWKQGIPMSFITVICIWAVYLDFQIFNAVTENAIVFLIIGIVAAYVFGFSLLYVYPLLARYENTIVNCLRNSFRISMKFFLCSLLLVLILAFELAVIFWNGTTLFVGMLMGPAFIMYTVSAFAIKIFHELDKAG